MMPVRWNYAKPVCAACLGLLTIGQASPRTAAPDPAKQQIGVVIERPGVIRHTGTMARLIFGEVDNRRTARIEALLEACVAAGVDAEVPEDINLAIWQKFALLVPMAACTAAMRSTIGPIRANPQTRAFLLDITREVVAVGRALGVGLADDFA